jgi:tetratricopeptide (TPR) repeat protein
LYYYANELKDHSHNEKAIQFYNLFLNTKKGWVEDNIAACGKLSDCYAALGNQESAMESALRSFQYGSPRSENCCRIGYYHLQSGAYETAAYWYNTALHTPKQDEAWSLQNTSCSTWLPHLQLCVCYDKLGQWLKAYEHNEIARAYRPNHPSVLHNKAYLEGVLTPLQTQEEAIL